MQHPKSHAGEKDYPTVETMQDAGHPETQQAGGLDLFRSLLRSFADVEDETSQSWP